MRGKRQRVNEWGRWKQLKRKSDEKESADSLKGFTSRLTELHTNRISNIINIQIWLHCTVWMNTSRFCLNKLDVLNYISFQCFLLGQSSRALQTRYAFIARFLNNLLFFSLFFFFFFRCYEFNTLTVQINWSRRGVLAELSTEPLVSYVSWYFQWSLLKLDSRFLIVDKKRQNAASLCAFLPQTDSMKIE